MSEIKTRRSPVPQRFDSILAGALKLSISEKVKLVKALKETIDKELADLNSKLEETKSIVNGL